MGQVTKVLLLLAVVVPVTAYVAGSLASPGTPPPADHSPVILRDAPADPPATTEPAAPPRDQRSPRTPRPDPDDGGPGQDSQRGDDEEARVVTPQPTPVGEDDDDERDDGDDDDDDTDDGDDADGDDGDD